MPGKLTITIKANAVNILRGSSNKAGVIGRATVGQVFDVVQILDTPESKEQWARIEFQSYPEAYICTRMANGMVLAQAGVVPDHDNADYVRGWNACVAAFQDVLNTMLR